MEISALYQKFLDTKGVCTDTRNIEPGTIFFALKGANFNGNQYADTALEKGARYAVIDEETFKKDDRFFLVPDVLTALQQLANYHRRQLNIPFIAITGSNGKTTTKELINAVLSAKFKTYATKGNLNNHIGVPLTLLSVKKDTEIVIVEMGANHQREIASYCEVAEPSHGMITNIGKAHLEGFGGVEGIKKGKGELYDFLLQSGGTAFINSNDAVLMDMSKFTSPVLYGKKGDFYFAELISADPFIRFKTEEGEEVQTELMGAYNFSNIMAALCMGKYFGVPAADANKAVASYVPQNNRSQIMKKGENEYILDAYNANPSSMKAAIENFASMNAEKKAIILGDMFELGEESQEEHAALGRLINKSGFDTVLLCGKHMEHAHRQAPGSLYFPEKELLQAWLKENPFKGYTVLVKGSRGMGLESLIDN